MDVGQLLAEVMSKMVSAEDGRIEDYNAPWTPRTLRTWSHKLHVSKPRSLLKYQRCMKVHPNPIQTSLSLVDARTPAAHLLQKSPAKFQVLSDSCSDLVPVKSMSILLDI